MSLSALHTNSCTVSAAAAVVGAAVKVGIGAFGVVITAGELIAVPAVVVVPHADSAIAVTTAAVTVAQRFRVPIPDTTLGTNSSVPVARGRDTLRLIS
ncbi:hypothetical protein MMAGJ_52370 [Mycolicibacterium mageritense]|uniref:Secreted protein n=1 Tax=Mycolicibacterium mageritense TaxID=53462 RepID=A0ABN5YE96_MYCME|nr:hypothetical protein MMAGJ_52370 [Mycolicibacterium mageritense]